MISKQALLSFTLILSIVMAVSACKGGSQMTIPRSVAGVSNTGHPYSIQSIEQAVYAGLNMKQWRVEERGNNFYVATVGSNTKHWATIRVEYNAGGWTISHMRSSPDLLYKNTSKGQFIHKRYNRWVASLDKTIHKQLSLNGNF